TRQAEQFVNAGDRSIFDIAQSGMRNVEIRIPFDVGNRPTHSFDIARLNGSFFPQVANPFTGIHFSGPPLLLWSATRTFASPGCMLLLVYKWPKSDFHTANSVLRVASPLTAPSAHTQ